MVKVGVRPPARWHIPPCGHRLRSVESVADTKLNAAAKGATLLQLISLSADAFQGP